jgi:hypothetical protein
MKRRQKENRHENVFEGFLMHFREPMLLLLLGPHTTNFFLKWRNAERHQLKRVRLCVPSKLDQSLTKACGEGTDRPKAESCDIAMSTVGAKMA